MRMRFAGPVLVVCFALLTGCDQAQKDVAPSSSQKIKKNTSAGKTLGTKNATSNAKNQTGDTPPVVGAPIKSLKTGQQVGKPILKPDGLIKELVGKQIFLQGDRPGSKPLGVSFYADSTWINTNGDVGRFEANGTTLMVTDDSNETIPHIFPNNTITIGDVLKVEAGGLTFENTITEITDAVDANTLRKELTEKAQETVDEPDEIDGYKVVGFDELAKFKYEVPDDPITDPKAKAILEKNIIPEKVRALDRKKIAVRGYMLPLRVEDGLITEFLVLRDQSACCFGAVPKINEWISVRMPKGKGVKPVMDVPVYFFGKLKVGEVLENDYLVGIYEMDGDKIGGPL